MKALYNIILCAALLFPATVLARPGVSPTSRTTCPPSHPIKGNWSTKAKDTKCIAHPPGGRYYGKTYPEHCYKTMDEARADGCRPPKKR